MKKKKPGASTLARGIGALVFVGAAALVLALPSGCSFFRGVADQLTHRHPASEEIEELVARIDRARKEYEGAKASYDRLVDSYNLLVEQGANEKSLRSAMEAVLSAEEAMRRSWDSLKSLLEQARIITVRTEESGGGLGYAAGGLVAGLLASLGAHIGARKLRRREEEDGGEE